MVPGTLLIVIYVAVVLCPPALILLISPASQHGFLFEFGKALALISMTIIFLQGMLAGRFKWAERPFGLDILIRFHKNIAVAAIVLLLLHPLLLAAGGGGLRLLISLSLPWYIWVGKITLVLLIVNVVLSVTPVSGRLSFETWRLVHNILMASQKVAIYCVIVLFQMLEILHV